MKKTSFLIAIVLVFMWSCSNPGDPEKVLVRARKYTRQGKYEKALKDLIWFHDNALKYKASLYGVRLSFALLDWIELGKKYPKAINALIDIRNRKADLIRKGGGTLSLFHDVQSINKYLNESKKTAVLYKEMVKCDFDLAKQCYCVAEDDLIAHGEFKICNQMMEAPMFIVRDMRNLLKKNIAIYKTKQWADETHLDWAITYYLQEAEDTLIVLVKNNRYVEARRFITDAAEGMDIARIKSGLTDLKNKYLPESSPGAPKD